MRLQLQLQQGQGQAMPPPMPVNYFNLPPSGPAEAPRYPSMDPTAMGSHSQRSATDSNEEAGPDQKRVRRETGAGAMGSMGPPPGFQYMPPMQFFPGMPPGMMPQRPPFPGGMPPAGAQQPHIINGQ